MSNDKVARIHAHLYSCLRCGEPTEWGGWSHFDPNDAFCGDCAFLISGPEFVRETLGLFHLASDLGEARRIAVAKARIDRRMRPRP